MGNFNRGRSGGGRGFERRGFSDRGSRGPAQMHPATCDKCQQSCEVPFRPTQGKPVFCSNCFDRNRNSDAPRFENRSFDRPSNFENKQPVSDHKEQFEQLNNKLDKILMMLTPKNDFPAPELIVNEEVAEEVLPEKPKASRKKSSA